ncbi:MAG: DUF1330 domain-containing protein [Phenylobacterium sp.]|uniref:DUF1330 domain-containing protein n=1 Tax=Phenylobacterium sp. TaxID=1871053 RepID=UPI00391B8C2E
MSAYILAQISIHDRPRYERYASAFMPVLQKYGGRLLATDEAAEVLQGDWGRDKLVLLAFPDRATALRWAQSPEYREISKDRIAATEGVVLLVQGID